jgi:N utilization substance protein B
MWQILAADPYLKKTKQDLGISWDDEEELIRTIYNKIKESKTFQDYLNAADLSFEDERSFAKKIFREVVIGFELLEHYYSEKNLYWESNIDLANRLVLDTLDEFTPRLLRSSSRGSMVIKNVLTKEDNTFVKNLFTKTIKHNSEFEKWIGEKAKNWDTDRIAYMDILLMKMALCEILEFDKIPVKVSLNEYIEISKYYSAPQSRGFINGILDKLINDLNKNKSIQKKGRGLIDS